MQQTHFINSFSKGQVTIPKTVRDMLGLGDLFWLKLTAFSDKIVLEPAEPKKDKSAYLKKLLTIRGDWVNETDWKKLRDEVETDLKKYDSP
jgi:bifunctional DNA-binding transcriptional regulator/antitoxin component of YhaV-PrlF toxin-antitoxin module